MITTFSGREGAKKLEDVVRKLAAEDGNTVTESTKAQGFIVRVKTALKEYWKGVANMLHIHSGRAIYPRLQTRTRRQHSRSWRMPG